MGIGVLGYRSPETLYSCLKAMADRDFFKLADEKILLAQHTQEIDRKFAAEFGLPLIETPRNYGIMDGMHRIARAIKTDYILNIEEDAIMAADPETAVKQVRAAMAVLAKGEADVCRFQAPELRYGIVIPIVKFLRFHAPEPLRLRDTFRRKMRRLLRPKKAIKVIGGAAFCLDEPEKYYREYISRNEHDHFVVDSACMTWRNSGILFSRRWFLDELIPYALAHPSSRKVNGHQDLEKELNCRWWRRRGYKIAVARSLFDTKRIDFPPDSKREG